MVDPATVPRQERTMSTSRESVSGEFELGKEDLVTYDRKTQNERDPEHDIVE